MTPSLHESAKPLSLIGSRALPSRDIACPTLSRIPRASRCNAYARVRDKRLAHILVLHVHVSLITAKCDFSCLSDVQNGAHAVAIMTAQIRRVSAKLDLFCTIQQAPSGPVCAFTQLPLLWTCVESRVLHF